MTRMSTGVWRNWAGTQTCRPLEYIVVDSVQQVCDVVGGAADRGVHVRVVGAGHSFTPVVTTDGIILDISGLAGIQSVDTVQARARVWAGSTLSSLGDPLWEAGYALRNQGDIDSQTVAGAISTATHGSGLGFTSFSGVLTRAELVTARGEVLVIDEDDPRMDAVRTSVGSLGVLTNVELQVMPAYQLAEQIDYWPVAEVFERWAAETRSTRHFSFFWGPYDESLALYGLSSPDSSPVGGTCFVKRYEQLPADAAGVTSPTGRVDRSYRIYPGDFPEGFDELEYFVPYPVALEAAAAVFSVVRRYPDQRYPVEVRTIAAETGFLSPMYGRDSVCISVSGAVGTDYREFLESVDGVLREFGGRPHWGKTHFLDADRLRDVYPRYDEFVAIRRTLDPSGMFLNDHLGSMVR